MKVKIVRMLASAVTMTVSGGIAGYGFCASMYPLDRGLALFFAGLALAAGMYALQLLPKDDD